MIKAKRWKMLAKQHAMMEDFEFDETALKEREVAVRAEYTAISPGTECANYLALDPNVLLPGKWCTYPWIPGYSGCGQIIAVGSGVSQYKVGGHVVGNMPHASHAICKVDDDVIALDPKINPQQASYLRVASICFTPLMLLQAEALPTIGVWGLGMIGNLTAQLLHHAGSRVIGIDPVEQRCALAKQCGIRETLDPKSPQFSAQIQEITGGQGFDIAVDSTGHAPTTLSLPSMVRPRGQIVLMTHWRSQPVLDASLFIHLIFNKGITLHGGHETGPGKAPWARPGAVHLWKLQKVQQELAAGGLQIAPLISHVIKPAQCAQAYDGLSFDRAKWWGVVVDWRAG
jgi:2-desacetyl-2-hydroxyethyl bacteriochlorophyllide A dehydrogenase